MMPTLLQRAGRSTAALRFIDHCDDQEVTVDELLTRSIRLAAVIQHRAPGAQTVALFGINRPYLVASLLAIWRLGLQSVVLPCPPGAYHAGTWRKRWQSYLESAQVDTLMVSTDAQAWVRDLSKSLTGLVTIHEAQSLPNRATLTDNREGSFRHKQFTSGTTGQPTALVVDHAQLVRNADATHARLRISADERFVSWLPPYHDMGFAGVLCGVLASGASATLIDTRYFVRNPLSWFREMQVDEPVIAPAPVSAFDKLAALAGVVRRRRIDLNSWRVAPVGAELVREGVLARFAEAFSGCGLRRQVFAPCYGMAEATLTVTASAAGEPVRTELFDERRLVSCGPPIDAVRVRTPTHGAAAEIEVRSTMLSSSCALAEGWLRTGDVGYVRAGELYVSGRLDDRIIFGGVNVSPDWLEQCAQQFLACMESVRRSECAAVQLEDGSVHLIVSGRGLDESVNHPLREWIRTRCEMVVYVRVQEPPLPRTTSGKLSRAQVRQMLLAG